MLHSLSFVIPTAVDFKLTINRIEALEMRIVRRVLKISWTIYVKNVEVSKRDSIAQYNKTKKTAYLGDDAWDYELLKLI